MADTKMTALTQLTTAADDDILHIIDDPGGSPISKHIEVTDLLRTAHGHLSVTGGAGTQTPTAATWTKVTQFDTAVSGLNVTADHSNDRILLDNVGQYLATWMCTFTGAADEYRLAIYWNSAISLVPAITTVPGTDEEVVAVTVPVTCTIASTYVEPYVYTVGGNAFAIKESVLSVVRVG